MQIFGEPAADTKVGLFESISGAKIKNLGMVDCNINITVKTYAYVGAISGRNSNYNNINNCYANGKITVSGKATGNCYIGGLTKSNPVKDLWSFI